jgi:hypothetical protein
MPKTTHPETRLKNLRALVETVGSIAELNERLGRDRRDPYIYSLLAGAKNGAGKRRAPGTAFRPIQP